jgi:hypothetical protein
MNPEQIVELLIQLVPVLVAVGGVGHKVLAALTTVTSDAKALSAQVSAVSAQTSQLAKDVRELATHVDTLIAGGIEHGLRIGALENDSDENDEGLH